MKKIHTKCIKNFIPYLQIRIWSILEMCDGWFYLYDYSIGQNAVSRNSFSCTVGRRRRRSQCRSAIWLSYGKNKIVLLETFETATCLLIYKTVLYGIYLVADNIFSHWYYKTVTKGKFEMVTFYQKGVKIFMYHVPSL